MATAADNSRVIPNPRISDNATDIHLNEFTSIGCNSSPRDPCKKIPSGSGDTSLS